MSTNVDRVLDGSLEPLKGYHRQTCDYDRKKEREEDDRLLRLQLNEDDDEIAKKKRKKNWPSVAFTGVVIIFLATMGALGSSVGSNSTKEVRRTGLDMARAKYGSEEPALTNDRVYEIFDEYEDDSNREHRRTRKSSQRNGSSRHKETTTTLERLNQKLGGMVWPFDGPKPSSKEGVKGSLPFLKTTKKELAKLGADDPTPGVLDGTENDLLPTDSQTNSINEEYDEQKKMVYQIAKEEEANSSSLLAPAIEDDLDIYDPAFHNPQKEFLSAEGRKRLEAFRNPPNLNETTLDTGRLRRLGRTLYLDGKPWLMRSVCYSPVPIGADPDWFEPYGDYFTSNYAGIFERDIPLLADAGVNAIRIYTLKYSHRHTQFFDLCHQYGIVIIVGYDFEDGTKSFFNDEESMTNVQRKLRSQVRAAKHPAIGAWIVGNELNGPWNLFVCDKDLAENFGISGCQFEDSIEKLMKSVNLLCSVVRSEGILCGTALANVNLPKTKQHVVGMQMWGALAWIRYSDAWMDQLDFWAVNMYTRRFWSPLTLFKKYHLVSKKPFIVSEYGVDAYKLAPQHEGWNGYDTMGEEDEIAQADWTTSMIEDLEKHSTTCASGCGTRFVSGGSIMAWVDEYWKGKAVTAVPTTDERIPIIEKVCPSLKEKLHSPCGYMSPTQPDLYTSEEYFGMMKVAQRCKVNHVDLLQPRAVYFMLKLLWKKGGTCTPFYGAEEVQAYDPLKYPKCGEAINDAHNASVHAFAHTEAEAWHQIKLKPGQQVPSFAFFENFSAILAHPPGLINPTAVSLQSPYLTCHHQMLVHQKSPTVCPAPPAFALDVEGFITKENSTWTQPGDTSCPGTEGYDLNMLDLKVQTWLKIIFVGYVIIALGLKRKQLGRLWRDASHALVRAKTPVFSWFSKSHEVEEIELTKNAAQATKSPPSSQRFNSELASEPATTSSQDIKEIDGDDLTRRGPEPTGKSEIEISILKWRNKILPIAQELASVFGFQHAGVDNVGATVENVADRLAVQLWNIAQTEELKGKSEDFIVEQRYSKSFRNYVRWRNFVGDLGIMHSGSLESQMMQNKLRSLVLFECIADEAGNCRGMPEMIAFLFHICSNAITANGKPVNAKVMKFESGDFVESIIMPVTEYLATQIRSDLRVYRRLGYDDVNECYLIPKKLKRLTDNDTGDGTTVAYVNYRNYMRRARTAAEIDQTLGAIFEKTHSEYLGWSMVVLNFNKMFTFMTCAFAVMTVYLFAGLQWQFYSYVAGVAAWCDLFVEVQVLVIHQREFYKSRTASIVKLVLSLAMLLATAVTVYGIISLSFYAPIGFIYVAISMIDFSGIIPMGGQKEYLGTKEDLKTDRNDGFRYRLFWVVVLLFKFFFDFLFVLTPLEKPTRAILQLDLYCWGYDFAGEDCDQYDYSDMLPGFMIHIVRVFRRNSYKYLVVMQRWLPSILLYYADTFFWYLIGLGVASAYDRLRWKGVEDGWSKVVRELPLKIAAFGDKILATKQLKPAPPSSASTHLCSEAASEQWREFARAWNAVVKSLRKRDLLSDEERSALAFAPLYGKTVKAFFGGDCESYVLFPTMLTAPVFAKAGAERNASMKYALLGAVLSQMIDVSAFLFVCIFGIVDATKRAEFCTLLKSASDLMGIVVRRESTRAPVWLIDIRTLVHDGIKLIRKARDDADLKGENSNTSLVEACKVFKKNIEKAIALIKDNIVADDNEKLSAAHKETNVVLGQVCDAILKVLANSNKLEDASHVNSQVKPALLTAPGRRVIDVLHRTFSTANPTGEPDSAEAREILRFFLESLTDPQLQKAKSVLQTPALSTLTPMYVEEIELTTDDLREQIDGENVSTFRFLTTMLPREWANVLERTKLHLPHQNYEAFIDELAGRRETNAETAEDVAILQTISRWASDRTQTLSRTVRGFSSYADATRLLARLEGTKEEDVEALVRAKYEHVLSCQMFGVKGWEAKDKQIVEMCKAHPHTVVTHYEQPDLAAKSIEGPGSYYYLCRSKIDYEEDPSGIMKLTHKIRLPGNPIIGEGKPENQNLGIVFARGNYMQTIDMNQDAQLSEGLKVRNLIRIFDESDDTVIVGFPEQMITEQNGSVAQFSALSEQVFGTMVQRYMAKPLCVRFHYGHPDVWDLAWVRSNGGVSKATRSLHLSEDIFGGMNVVLRGGKVRYVGFKMVGKAREVSFDGANQFHAKIATGNGMQLISRDFHRLSKNFDFLRQLSFFQSSAGIMFTEFVLFASLFTFVVTKLIIVMVHVETYFKSGDAFDNIGFHEEIGTHNIYPSHWFVQASFVMAWPVMLEGWLDGGFVNMFSKLYQHTITGSFIFNMFIAKMRGFSLDSSINTGEAAYMKTKRGMTMRASFVSLYSKYAESHIKPAIEMAWITAAIMSLSTLGALHEFFASTWHVWFAVWNLTMAPWLFHPQTFKSGMISFGLAEWVCWLDSIPRGDDERTAKEKVNARRGLGNKQTWWIWRAETMRNWRKLPMSVKFWHVCLRLLPGPILLSMAAAAALNVGDASNTTALRPIIILTAGVAAFLLGAVYYFALSPQFLWPHRLVSLAKKFSGRGTLSEVTKQSIVLIYGYIFKFGCVILHHFLCQRLFSAQMNQWDFLNAVVFAISGYVFITCAAAIFSLISDQPPRAVRGLMLSLRSYGDFMVREVDIINGTILHIVLFVVGLFPISFMHARALFNRAYAAVLKVEMRRREMIASINREDVSAKARQKISGFKSFFRKVIGLQVKSLKYKRPAPTVLPDVPRDMTVPGSSSAINPRCEDLKKRLMPLFESQSTLFGFQKTCPDSNFSKTPVEVKSNMHNALENMSRWIENTIATYSEESGNCEDGLTEGQWSEAINHLHGHMFLNFKHWLDYTGMLDQAQSNADVQAFEVDNSGTGEEKKSPILSLFMAQRKSNEVFFNNVNREEFLKVETNAKAHHLTIWFLLYGESANLRHMSEVLCYLFHCALCAVTLESRSERDPETNAELVLAQPIKGSQMPFKECDYLNNIVTPMYLFMRRELKERNKAAIVDRVMYDDVNEFFWEYDRFKAVMPPVNGHANEDVERREAEMSEEEKKKLVQPEFIGVPMELRDKPVDQRMYSHLRAYMMNKAKHPLGAGEGLATTFFKTHREVAGWFSLYVNFNTVIVFHAVCFHISCVCAFVDGFEWAYVCTATVTHAVLKLICEFATLSFRNLKQESFEDWIVIITRCIAFITIPLFYGLEKSFHPTGKTPYFQALAAVYSLAMCGVMTTVIKREPYMGGSAQFATPFRDRCIYSIFWIFVLGTKLAFGHFLLIPPLRESVNALQHPDLCWNKESDTYTSCINLDGDALKNALRFEAREKYFLQDITKEEELIAEQLDPLDYDDDYEEDKTMRRALLSATNARFDLSKNIGKIAAILGGGDNITPLASLGYIGEEIEGEIPSSYYDVHASTVLMYLMTVMRVLPALVTYFCDTFVWYTVYATAFTIALQWWGKISHAQNWSYFLRTFSNIPVIFCDKCLNRKWPKPEFVVRSGDGGLRMAESDSEDEMENPNNKMLGMAKGLSAGKSGGGYSAHIEESENPEKDSLLTITEQVDESDPNAYETNPADFCADALDIKWQHFGRAWNSIAKSLRERDHISDAEYHDLCFSFLSGRDMSQIFHAPEYVILPAMMTSTVFSTVSFQTGTMKAYPAFYRTMVQTKDLLSVLFTDALRLVAPRDLEDFMKIICDIAQVENEQMHHRKTGDIESYMLLRDAIIRMLQELKACGVDVEAEGETPDSDIDSESDNDDDDEDKIEKLLASGEGEEAERVKKSLARKRYNRQKRELREKELARQEQMLEAMNLELKYGCTGFFSKKTRKKMREKGGRFACFVIEENIELTEAEKAAYEEMKQKDEERELELAGSSKKTRKTKRKEAKRFKNITLPQDADSRGERVAEAVHDVLLSVRKICAFAMERDSGKWSAHANQYKYKVSQMYSKLLDMIQSDLLRDKNHIQVVAASAASPEMAEIIDALLRSMNSSNPGGQPRSAEAQRQLMFFSNSLRFTALRTPSDIRTMRGFSAFTPYYAEDVAFQRHELTTHLEDEKTLFSLIIATFPDDYENFKERVKALHKNDDEILNDHWDEVQKWTSDRSQTLGRCIRGVCMYGDALRLQARAEGIPEESVERLVTHKFEYVVTCQVFGRMRQAAPGTMDRAKATEIERLIKRHRDLKICFVDMPRQDVGEDNKSYNGFASCLVGIDEENNDELQVTYKVRLPGDPIIGEGKPENQNHAIIFTRGSYLQTLDMNQDNYMGESFKIRNLMDVFRDDVVLVGFPEVIFSETHGAVAQFAAISEFIFQTFQRFMTWPLMVRFHYGHPDVWDKAFASTNGGVSKASKMIHVAEDFFGGVNAVARGGKVLFEEFIECGKGRDMGFTSVNGFEQKISGSAGTISMSRDLFRLHRGLDFFRVFSLYFSGPGFYVSVMQTSWAVYFFALTHASLAIADLELYRVYRYFKMTETQTTLSLSKEEGGYYNSIYALQIGLLTLLPLLFKMIMDRGVRAGLEYTLQTQLAGSWAFNVFTMATKGYNYMRSLIFGQAMYIGTERGYVLSNASMVVLYGLYAKSHLYLGFEVLFYLLLFHCNTSVKSSILYAWSVWPFAICLIIAPWWFSPQSTNLYWMHRSWQDWRKWLDGTYEQQKVSSGSWQKWHASMLEQYREMLSVWYKFGVVCFSALGRLVLIFVLIGAYHGTELIEGVTQDEQFSRNCITIALASLIMSALMLIQSLLFSMRSLDREHRKMQPDELWKISVLRGGIRFSFGILWLGLYGAILYEHVPNLWVFRQLFYATIAAVCVNSVIIECFILIGTYQIETSLEFLLKTGVDADGNPTKLTGWKPRVAYGYRNWLQMCRNYGDYWYKEMDKFLGGCIFGFLFFLSLLPVAWLQTMLIWNDTFSDVMQRRTRAFDATADVLN
jgi:1,3-beta-glucan synthase